MNGSSGVGGGRDSPLRPPPCSESGEDILAKLRHQVSMASHREGSGVSPPETSPLVHLGGNPFLNNLSNLNNNGQSEIYSRLNALLHAKMKHNNQVRIKISIEYIKQMALCFRIVCLLV